jgi:hypothetical protein
MFKKQYTPRLLGGEKRCTDTQGLHNGGLKVTLTVGHWTSMQRAALPFRSEPRALIDLSATRSA